MEWLLFLTERRLFGTEPVDAEQARSLRQWAADFGESEIERLAALDVDNLAPRAALDLLYELARDAKPPPS